MPASVSPRSTVKPNQIMLGDFTTKEEKVHGSQSQSPEHLQEKQEDFPALIKEAKHEQPYVTMTKLDFEKPVQLSSKETYHSVSPANTKNDLDLKPEVEEKKQETKVVAPRKAPKNLSAFMQKLQAAEPEQTATTT